MKFKTPSFWYGNPKGKKSIQEAALSPLSWVYALGRSLHQSVVHEKRVSVPVICVGNLTAGGSGKTPTAIALNRLIREHTRFKNPFFLTRGYGGRLKGPVCVDHTKHSYTDIGDEALLLSCNAPTVVSGDRYQGALHAIEHGADVIIMDDGLQNPGLYKDFRLVVIDGHMGFGNRKMIPAGPLRDSLATAFDRVDAFVLIGGDKHNVCSDFPEGIPVFQAKIKPDKETLPEKSRSYTAFCGIGYPEKFFSFLKAEGYKLSKEISFSDHYPYTSDDIDRLVKLAGKQNSFLLTTEKDYMRIPQEHKKSVECIPITLSFENEKDILKLISSK